MSTLARTALALLAACTLALPSMAAEPPKEVGPAMWKISDADSTIYLFGTFHVLPKDLKWQTEAFRVAMAASTITAIETDTESAYARSSIAGAALEYGLNPSWQTLRGVLGAERYAKLSTIAKTHGIEMKRLQKLRPWLALSTISGAIMTANGYARESGVERVVIKAALAEHDKVLTLETPEAQIKALATLDGPEMLDEFDVTIAGLGDFKTKIDPLLAAWRTGDLVTFDRLSTDEMRRLAPAAYRAIVYNRNWNWTQRLQTWMKGKGNYFVAVGAAHFTGPDSVIAMLEKRGLKAQRVQ